MGIGKVGMVLGMVGAATFAAREAHACSCLSWDDANKYAEGAEVVFEGVLERIEERGQRLENVFDVTRVWKGAVAEQISIDSWGGTCEPVNIGDSCGVTLTVGETYLVFATVQGYCLPSVNICSGTRLSSEAAEAFAQLGPSTPPSDGGIAPSEPCAATACPDFDAGTGGTTQIPSDAGAAGGSDPVEAGSGAGPSSSADPDLDAVSNESSGCSCTTPSAPRFPPMAALLALTVAAAAARRRLRLT
jgi:MYXO-CTERM domain-containing protein